MSSALEENRVCLEINGFQGKTYRKFRKNCRRGRADFPYILNRRAYLMNMDLWYTLALDI
jgi:hypothetical protein